MVTSGEVLAWIDQNVEVPLTDWQRDTVRAIFDQKRSITIQPRKSGRTYLSKIVERAMNALGA